MGIFSRFLIIKPLSPLLQSKRVRSGRTQASRKSPCPRMLRCDRAKTCSRTRLVKKKTSSMSACGFAWTTMQRTCVAFCCREDEEQREERTGTTKGNALDAAANAVLPELTRGLHCHLFFCVSLAPFIHRYTHLKKTCTSPFK